MELNSRRDFNVIQIMGGITLSKLEGELIFN